MRITLRPTTLSWDTFTGGERMARPVAPDNPVRRSRAAGTLVLLLDKGLIGFDVETGRRIVRPELLRLLKRGNQHNCRNQRAVRPRRLIIR
jgi:hypothetical protein